MVSRKECHFIVSHSIIKICKHFLWLNIQPFYILFFFIFCSKFAFLKIIYLNKFWNWQKCIYFQKDATKIKFLRKSFIVLAYHNSTQLLFFQIRIFENYMFIQIPKSTKNYLFSKGCVWEKIVEKEIYWARLAKLGKTFVISKKQNGGAGEKTFFQNFRPNFHFFSKIVCGKTQHKLSLKYPPLATKRGQNPRN